MTKILMGVLLFSSFNIFARGNDQEVSFCEKEGARYGDGSGKDKIPFECEDVFLKLSRPEAFKRSSDAKIVVFGHKNIIFIKNPMIRIYPQNVIAGSATELTNIVAIAIDEKNNEIAVLEESGDVLFFSSLITGNVAPLRIIKNKNLYGARDIIINSDKNEIIVLNKLNKELLFFSRLGNIHAPEGKRNLHLIKNVENVNGEMMALDIKRQDLFILRSTRDSYSVFNLRKKIIKEDKVVVLNSKNIQRIEYSSVKDQLVGQGMDVKVLKN